MLLARFDYTRPAVYNDLVRCGATKGAGMRFIVCGAGAIGGVLGGQLAKAGFEVLLVDTAPAHVAAITAHGLHLEGVHGTHVLRLPILPHLSAVAFRPDDIVILAVKAWQSAAAVADLRRATALDLPIVCAQNGIANESLVAQAFAHVQGLMVLTGATCLEPGVVIQTGNGPLGVGTYPVGVSPAAAAVAAALEQTDLPGYTTDDICSAKWYKLLLNLNNATLGLTGQSTHAAMADAATRHWIADVWEEGAHVLQAAGIAYANPPGLASLAEQIQHLRLPPAPAPALPAAALQGRSSLWQDLYLRRGQVEAVYLNGEIVRLGQQYGVPTPYNHLLLTLSQALAVARAVPGQYTIPQLRAALPPV